MHAFSLTRDAYFSAASEHWMMILQRRGIHQRGVRRSRSPTEPPVYDTFRGWLPMALRSSLLGLPEDQSRQTIADMTVLAIFNIGMHTLDFPEVWRKNVFDWKKYSIWVHIKKACMPRGRSLYSRNIVFKTNEECFISWMSILRKMLIFMDSRLKPCAETPALTW